MTRESMLRNSAQAFESTHSLIVTRNMSITAEQFVDRLPQVKEGVLDSCNPKEGAFRLRNVNGSVAISCRQTATRYIGSLALPVIEVRLDFRAYRSADIGRFVKSFDLAFLKAGC